MIAFAHRYSAQLGFAAMVIVFLMVTVGEGQAYDVGGSVKLASSLQTNPNQNNGFFGRPQLVADQTVTTGEVQQNVAIVYQVAQGDSVTSIADRYSLSPGTILDANHINALDANKITPGQQLLIPSTDTNTSQDWLNAINAEKQKELQLAEQQRQKQLAAQRRATTPRVTGPSFSGDVTYVSTLWGAYNGGVPGQCTWLVNHYRHFPGPMGNGGAYLASARSYGLATGSVPRVGAVIVTAESYYGHVGIVRSVEGGTITIEEMNYLGPGKIDYRKIGIGTGFIKGYIY